MQFQDDTSANSKSNKEKLQKTLIRQSPIEGEIPYLLKILNLTRRKPSNDPPQTRLENGFSENETKEQVSKIDQIHYDCDTYREWKEGFISFLIEKLLFWLKYYQFDQKGLFQTK